MHTVLTTSETLGEQVLLNPQGHPLFTTFEAMSLAYSSLRDELGEGASTFLKGVVRDEVGRRTNIISYNGKVWDVSRWPLADDGVALIRANNALGLLVYDPNSRGTS